VSGVVPKNGLLAANGLAVVELNALNGLLSVLEGLVKILVVFVLKMVVDVELPKRGLFFKLLSDVNIGFVNAD